MTHATLFDRRRFCPNVFGRSIVAKQAISRRESRPQRGKRRWEAGVFSRRLWDIAFTFVLRLSAVEEFLASTHQICLFAPPPKRIIVCLVGLIAPSCQRFHDDLLSRTSSVPSIRFIALAPFVELIRSDCSFRFGWICNSCAQWLVHFSDLGCYQAGVCCGIVARLYDAASRRSRACIDATP